MASTYTDGLAIEIIGPGDKAGSWGSITSNNLKSLEEGVSRYAEIEVEASATSDLDITNGATAYSAGSIGRSAVIKWINTVTPGTGTHTVSLKVASSNSTQARFTAINNLPSARALIISCGIGSSVTIPNGYSAVIHIEVNDAGVVSGVANSLANLSVDTLISSGLITGNLQGNATTVTNGVYTGNNLSALSPGATSTELRTRVNGTTGSGNLVFATAPTLTNPALGTPSALVGTNITGTAANLTAGNATLAANATNATNATTAATVATIPALTGAVTSSGSSNATTLANNAVLEVNIATSAVSEPKLRVSNPPQNGWILSATPLTSGGLTWIPQGTAGNVTSVTGGDGIDVTNGTSASPSVAVDSTVVRTPGTVVRETGIQTLTDKTLTAPSITSPVITGTGSFVGDTLTATGASGVSSPLLRGGFSGLQMTTTGSGKIVVNTNSTLDGSALYDSAMNLSAALGRIALRTGSTDPSRAKITFQTSRTSDNVTSEQFGVGRDGAYLGDAGGRYLNVGSTTGSGGFGLRGTSNTLNVKNNTSDDWGQPYHASMTSGTGAFFQSSVNLGSVTSGGLISDFSASQAHGLTTNPKLLRAVIRCINGSNAGGYAVGDEIPLDVLADTENSTVINDGVTYGANATNVFVHCNDLNEMNMVSSGGGAHVFVELAYWDIYVYAWK